MRILFSAVLMIFGAFAVFAQEQAPAGSAERGYEAYMKYQCYTCDGTVGQGADRRTWPKFPPNPISFAGFVRQLLPPGQDMPACRKQCVSEQEVADIYAYLNSI